MEGEKTAAACKAHLGNLGALWPVGLPKPAPFLFYLFLREKNRLKQNFLSFLCRWATMQESMQHAWGLSKIKQ